jgi:hypothetical protein
VFTSLRDSSHTQRVQNGTATFLYALHNYSRTWSSKYMKEICMHSQQTKVVFLFFSFFFEEDYAHPYMRWAQRSFGTAFSSVREQVGARFSTLSA